MEVDRAGAPLMEVLSRGDMVSFWGPRSKRFSTPVGTPLCFQPVASGPSILETTGEDLTLARHYQDRGGSHRHVEYPLDAM